MYQRKTPSSGDFWRGGKGKHTISFGEKSKWRGKKVKPIKNPEFVCIELRKESASSGLQIRVGEGWRLSLGGKRKPMRNSTGGAGLKNVCLERRKRTVSGLFNGFIETGFSSPGFGPRKEYG